jgi:hypothetical protein
VVCIPEKTYIIQSISTRGKKEKRKRTKGYKTIILPLKYSASTPIIQVNKNKK